MVDRTELVFILVVLFVQIQLMVYLMENFVSRIEFMFVVVDVACI